MMTTNLRSLVQSLCLGGLILGVGCGAETVPPATCDDGKSDRVAACVDQAEYLADLVAIAKPRATGTAHHATVRKLLVDRLKALKFEVTEQTYGPGTNVVGELKGTKAPDEIVIIGAHYDGVRDCAAADDNGTGTAGALQVAAALARHAHDRTVQIVFWDEEERGLTGSFHHAAQLAAAGRKVVTVYDFEMIGYTSEAADSQKLPAGFDVIFKEAGAYWWANDKAGDFIAVIYGYKSKIAALTFIEEAKKSGVTALPVELSYEFMESSTFGDLRRSDHTSYWAEGYPAMMLTDTANFRNTHYHCDAGSDSTDRLNHDFSIGIVKGVVSASVQLLKADGAAAVAPDKHTCSLNEQDCPPGKKCTLWAEGQRWMPTCMTVSATPANRYASCTRVKNKLGDDNCDVGLFCTPWGIPQTNPTTRHCVKPCNDNSVCGAGAVCVVMGRRSYGGGLVPRNVGLCAKSCDPFAADACGAGLMCSSGFLDVVTLKSTHTCMSVGTSPADGACSPMSWGACGLGLDCVYDGKGGAPACRRPCDDAHPCKTGTCEDSPYSAIKGLGHCQP